jgi:hypothetical protein
MANYGDGHDERIGQQLTVPDFPPHQPVGEKPSSQLNQANAISISTQRSRPSRGKVVLLIGLTLLIVGTIIGTILQLWATHHSVQGSSAHRSVQGGPGESRFIISSTYLLAKDYNLSGVAALSANDIWVIGDNPIRRPPRPQALFKHWNGSQWSIYPDPASDKETVSLRAIAADSASDVWAVGRVEESFHALIQHWNGSRWSVVPSPTIGDESYLVSVTAISANDAWAVGNYSPSGPAEQTLIEHWNGIRWSMIPSPHPGLGSWLSKVEAISANNIWAVGSFTDGFQVQTLTLHWDGSQWSVVKSPNPGKARNELISVTVVSAHDIWAVGSFSNSTQGLIVEETLILHWDGSQWSVVESPGPGNNNIFLSDVTALSANDVWAVGYETDIHGNSQKLIEHWDGSLWSVVKSPGPATDDALYGMDHMPQSNNIIVVGTMYYSTGETGTVFYITGPGEEALPKP